MTFAQASLVFALANMGFAFAESSSGSSTRCRPTCGWGDRGMLVRPLTLILQFVTTDFQLRRLGRVADGLVIMIWLSATWTSHGPRPPSTC